MFLSSIFFLILFTWFISQFLKCFIYCLKHKTWNLAAIFSNGSFPSSHVAIMTSLSLGLGFIAGFASHYFTIAFALLAIVINDAINVRWYSGINALKTRELVGQLSENKIIDNNDIFKLKDKIILGHKVSEVIGGITVGIITTLIFSFLKLI